MNNKTKTIEELEEFSGEDLGDLLTLAIDNHSNDLEYMKRLLAAGADLTVWGIDNSTALKKSIVYNRYDVIKIIVEAGANLEEKDEHGWTALHWASKTFEAFKSDIILEFLIKSGADLEAKNNLGETPLQVACVFSETETIKILLEAGANIEARNIDGMTPLHLASDWKRYNIISYLLEAGASKEALDNKDNTPWDLAPYNAQYFVPELNPKHND